MSPEKIAPYILLKIGQRGQSPCGHFNAGQRGQSLCGHSFLTQRRRRVYGVERSFYCRCFNRFQMSELEIDLELFAVHFALTGSGDSPRMGSGDNPHVVGRRGQWTVGTVPMWSGSGDRPRMGNFNAGQRGQAPCGHFPSASREDLSMGGES